MDYLIDFDASKDPVQEHQASKVAHSTCMTC